MDKNLAQLDKKNKELIIENKKISDVIFDVEIMHYRSRSLEDALKLNKQLNQINEKLTNKLADIYDI